MRIIKLTLFALALTKHASFAVPVNFTAAEGYLSGSITRHPDWSGSTNGFSVDASGAGSLTIGDSVSKEKVLYRKSLEAGSDFFKLSIEFSFKRRYTNSLSDHKNVISVELNQGGTYRKRSSRIGLLLQRFKKNPKLYRLRVIKTINGKYSHFTSETFDESLLGFAHTTDLVSDRLELKLKLYRGADASSWTASCLIQNYNRKQIFHFKTGNFDTDSAFFSSDLFPVIGAYDNRAKSLVYNKEIDSFNAVSVTKNTITEKPSKKPNVLFLVVDDLNDWTGLWKGHPNALTPNMDRLARMGLRFTNAHCSVPACNPSRSSVLSGMRAGTTGLYLNDQCWADSPRLNKSTPLPQRFRDHGYYAAATGKVFHHRMKEMWDEDRGKFGFAKPPKSERPLSGLDVSSSSTFDWGPLDVPNSEIGDWRAADYIIKKMGENPEKPFFLACGFLKPHLPWYVPREYFDRFPLEDIELPEVKEDDLNDIPPAGVEMALRFGDHESVLKKKGAWKEGVQGYLASTSFTDDCIGRILDALEKHPEKDNTIIVLWSDHGWHLGEKMHWRKFALWEDATRVPLIYVVPGMTIPNTATDAPVSLLDIYPTLLELAGLPADPKADGNSLTPLLKDWTTRWSHEAVTEHGYKNRSVRTYRWRYILYADGSEELYDHSKDPNEWTNLANKAGYQKIKGDLRKLLPKSYLKPPKQKTKC